MEEKPRSVKKFALFCIPALLLLAFVYTFFVLPEVIEKRVQGFCDSIEVGGAQDIATERARSIGLKVWVFPPRSVDKTDPQAEVRGWDGVIFNRYSCTIRALDGKITSKKYSHID
jgi:hypothetical protein